MPAPFQDFDLFNFWEDSDYARQEYVDNPLTREDAFAVEAQLGYKLPAAYVALSMLQNGGIPRRTTHRTLTPTSWSERYVAISGIFSIGSSRASSLLGEFGSTFWCEEWGYPPIGVYFADCPSAGHDMLCLDYRKCGPWGEPSVVHVDQERDYRITLVADNFESFIRGLELDVEPNSTECGGASCSAFEDLLEAVEAAVVDVMDFARRPSRVTTNS